MDDTEEVIEWLQAIDMDAYSSVFREHSVTGYILLSLNSAELRETLGVAKLGDRRIFLDNIQYLNQVLSLETSKAIPEDGRILTHLSNERLFLSWQRLSIILQTTAVATLRLVSINKENEKSIIVISSVLTATADIASIYALRRYLWLDNIIEHPGRDLIPDRVFALTPALFLFIGTLIGLYMWMSQSTEEAAMLAMLSI